MQHGLGCKMDQDAMRIKMLRGSRYNKDQDAMGDQDAKRIKVLHG